MHIFFSGIGGGALGPLALIARQAGHEVSGSDKQDSLYIDALRSQGLEPYIGQTEKAISGLHAKKPIDWIVYSSAVPKENPDHPELVFAEKAGIHHSKRDELLNMIIEQSGQQLLAVTGTHGKSTATAMVIWLFKELGVSASYSVGAKIPFGPMGNFTPESQYFIYECDEFDRNFLAFRPALSLISGIGWDHHEIFPTQEDYNQAFRDFIGQSGQTFIWDRDAQTLGLSASETVLVQTSSDPAIDQIQLHGRFNREDAWLAMLLTAKVTSRPIEELRPIMERFPGLKQRMELLTPNLYTNYAHTPEKIRGGMSAALEIAAETGQKVVAIYEPLTNRRQHYIKADYKDCFKGASKLYWVPTYLAREDPDLPVLTPAELITYLDDPSMAEPAALDDKLLTKLRKHLAAGDIVVAMGASGGGSMDEWLRQHFGAGH